MSVHYRLSSYREAMLEHLLVGELMRALWPTPLEVCKPQVDASGYDLILQCGGALRHVQLKTSMGGSARRDVNVQMELANRVGGCVIWTRFDPATFAPTEFLWLGGAPGQPLPEISGYRIAKHTKANAQGFKAERLSHRRVPQTAFTRLTSVSELLTRLFAAVPETSAVNAPERLVEHVRALADFTLQRSPAGNYQHMGATITESILQAGINYRTVVVPRVNALRENHPEAKTTSGFLALLEERGAGTVLDFGGEKPGRVLALTRFLQAEGVETAADLAVWLGEPDNQARLGRLHGVGPKTVDYIQILVGIDNSAVDRHLASFLDRAGVKVTGYAERKQIVEEAAALLGVDKAVLDYSIWLYMSDQAQAGRPRGGAL